MLDCRLVRRSRAAASLLVASDFDGTLAPIVSNPADARPLPGAADALRALAELPSTTVALVSGRALWRPARRCRRCRRPCTWSAATAPSSTPGSPTPIDEDLLDAHHRRR